MSSTKRFIILSYLLWVPATVLAGQVTYEPPVTQTWENANCAETDSCTLKEFSLKTQVWKADLTSSFGKEAYSWGKTATFSYETNSPESLKDYVFVQFVQGCVFDSWLENGAVTRAAIYVRPSFGKDEDWVNRGWVIDSIDNDPAYNSPSAEEYLNMPNSSRQGFYRWNTKPGSTDKSTEVYFGNQYPSERYSLYATDRPGTVFKGDFTAKNISLEFRTCIYKSADVPQFVAKSSDKILANPISCLEWRYSYVYDWSQNKFNSTDSLDPYCAVQK